MALTISALGAVYDRERPQFLDASLRSLTAQIRPADQVVLVCDGPISEALEHVVQSYRHDLRLETVRLERNVGLGRALNVGLAHCHGELVGRFDTDDINLPNRFLIQEKAFEESSALHICGGYVSEFEASESEAVDRIRRVPISHQEIVARAWFRNPFNHPSVMFRRAEAMQWGGYVEHLNFEDFLTWQLWIQRGARTANIPQPLVRMRIAKAFSHRRRGWSYLKQEVSAARFMHAHGLASALQCLLFSGTRLPLRLLPPAILVAVYRTIRALTITNR